ncbi:glycosyltransferase [Azospirillum sp. TSH100]|uniref:glycosyltransferase n=1 Tax=Azospirillum sp. TSH100 TaxID=652764 RepID=UPI0013048C52|nr:glycosyltransferase [Azospirillum sp. TSH100]
MTVKPTLMAPAMAFDADQIGLLLHGRIWLDLTETTSSFHRTGIQRTLARMIATAPDRGRLVPFTVAPDGMVVVHDHALLDLLADELFAVDDFERVSARIAELTARPLCRVDRDALLSARAVVNIEVFYNSVRAEFYAHLTKRMRERIFFLIYDIIPIGQPDHFKNHLPFAMEYFRFCLSVENIATISSFTRDQVVAVMGRRDPDNIRVITLGSDTFGTVLPLSPARLAADPPGGTPLFTVVGTVTDRKGHLLVLRTFRALWDEGVEAALAFLGNPDGATSDILFEEMEEAGRNPARFRWVRAPGDADIREGLASSWGTVYVSDGEGFGLGPLESLQAGVPTIVRSDYPSLADVPPLGQIRVPPHDTAALKAAVLSLLDRKTHQAARAELAGLTLKSWTRFGQDLNGWIEERAAPVQPVDDLGFEAIAAGGLRSGSLRACRDLLFGTANAFAKAALELNFDLDGWYGSGRLGRLVELDLLSPPLLVADLVHHSVAVGLCDRQAGVRTLLTCLALTAGRKGGTGAGRLHHDLLAVITGAPGNRSAMPPQLDRLPAEIDRLNRLDGLPAADFPTALARTMAGEALDPALWRSLCLFTGAFSATRRQALVKGLFVGPVSLETGWDRWVTLYCAASVVLSDPDWGRTPAPCSDMQLLSPVTPPALRDLRPQHSGIGRRFADARTLRETAGDAQVFEALTGRKPDGDQSAALRDLREAGACREALLAFIATHWMGLAPDSLDALRLSAAKSLLTRLRDAAAQVGDGNGAKDGTGAGLEPEAFISLCHAGILLRRADEADTARHLDILQRQSPFQLIEELMRSPDARQTYGDMAVAVIDANPRHNAFLTAPLMRSVERLLEVPDGQFAALLHKRLLGRTAQAGEADALGARLALGVSRERLIAETMAGIGFRARILPDPDEQAAVQRLLGTRLLERCRDSLRLLDAEGFTETCFLQFRGRLPTAEEKAGWPLTGGTGGTGGWRVLVRASLDSEECKTVFSADCLDRIRPLLADRLISRPSLIRRVATLLTMGEADFAARLHETLTGRRAAPSTRSTLAYRLSLGMPRETAIFQILGRMVRTGAPAAEEGPNATFVELVDALAVAIARRLHQAQARGTDAYVDACYLAVLGRPADSDARNGYAAVMRNEPRSGWLMVAQHLCRSSEYAGAAGPFAQSRLIHVIAALLTEPHRAEALLGLAASS